MLYAIAHFLRDKMPWLWNLVDVVNSTLFELRYGGNLKRIETEILGRYRSEYSIRLVPMREVVPEVIEKFFESQPEEAYKFFKPHGFDAKSIKKLQNLNSFQSYLLLDDTKIAGYCFLRCFFHGKAFRGRMVGIDYRGRGLGTTMNKFMNEVGFSLGLRIYETVSKDNVASYRSSLAASDVKVVEEMPNNEVFLEILPPKK